MHFTRLKETTSRGDTIVVFVETYARSDRDPFQIRASRKGVRFRGRSDFITSLEDLLDFQAAVDDAWQTHLALAGPTAKEG